MYTITGAVAYFTPRLFPTGTGGLGLVNWMGFRLLIKMERISGRVWLGADLLQGPREQLWSREMGLPDNT